MSNRSILNYKNFILKYTKSRNFSDLVREAISENDSIRRIRNIGILAHIDAGKTTTTERMLYYAGTIRSMGEVHHGNTVTDYMEQERQRGITITAAAVSFPWQEHQINLIDTPGHIDFTMEVEQSLGVLDGAVVVLDGSAGVEAQTVTVWRQADGYRIPRLIYANKMDRKDADITMCVNSLKDKLEVQPLLLHTPLRDAEDKLVGIIDIINIEEILWNTKNRGQKYKRRKLNENEDGAVWEKAISARRDLVDSLSDIDDKLADDIIKMDSLDNISSELLKKSIRESNLALKAFPLLCGSSYKNVGVQTLLEAIIDYLPSPLEGDGMYKCFGTDLCARAFKVQHDDQKGVLTYLRLFGGEIKKGQKIYNVGRQKTEQCGPLYIAYADEYETKEKVTAGNIAVVSGLKTTMTGDLVTSTQSASTNAKKNMIETLKRRELKEYLPPVIYQKLLSDDEMCASKEELANSVFGIGSTIPEPVFVCSIEPPSAAYQTSLETALEELQREDSSLRVTYNSETGQTVLAGMGELHLEIIKERIVSEYKVDAELGPLQIAYKETVVGEARESLVLERKIGSTKHVVNVTLSAKPAPNIAQDKIFRIDRSHESAENLGKIYPKHLVAVKQGVETALLHGPRLGSPIVDVRVTLHWLEVGRGTSETIISAAVSQCLRKVFESAGAVLLEPIMKLEVVCPDSYMSRVLADLARRRCIIQNIDVRGKNKVLQSLTPLSELLGYSRALRTLSSGLATFTMEFHNNQSMSPGDEDKAIRAINGF